MHFASFSDFMAMGGYAFYVWLSFGLTLVCLVGIIISTRMKTRSLLGELRKRNPNTKVVFVSGYAEEAFRKNLPEGEEFHFLPKPFTMKQLVETVKAAMG